MPGYSEWCHCVSQRSLCPSNREPLSGTNRGVGWVKQTPPPPPGPLPGWLLPSQQVKSHCAGSRPGWMQKGNKNTREGERWFELGWKRWHFHCCSTRSLSCWIRTKHQLISWEFSGLRWSSERWCSFDSCVKCPLDVGSSDLPLNLCHRPTLYPDYFSPPLPQGTGRLPTSESSPATGYLSCVQKPEAVVHAMKVRHSHRKFDFKARLINITMKLIF